MAVETFGSGITQEVADVISKREEIFGKKKKETEEIHLLNANAAWVKLRSSVNLGDMAQAKSLAKKKYPTQADHDAFYNTATNSEPAEQLVLMSGTKNAFPGGSTKAVRSGVESGTDYNATKAYNWSVVNGYRPMPGITNLSVKSKNTYGTLQVAEVSFIVWSLEELDKVSEVYFKPGFSALLEFGHSTYVDKNGNIQYTGQKNGTVSDKKFFTPTSFADIEAAANSIKKKHSYNYDFLYGFITNFNWSFRDDGGYDCSIKITSRGNVLDSLKVGSSTDLETESEDDKEKNKEERTSIWHSHFLAVEEAKSGLLTNDYTVKEVDGNKAVNDADYGLSGDALKPFKSFGFELDIVDGTFPTKALYFNETEVTLRYIPLYTVLDIFNKYGTIKDPEKSQSLIKFNIESNNEYYTFDNHFSIDPLPVILPKVPSHPLLKKFTITKGSLHEKVAKYIGGANSSKIMNLMVSTHMVKGELTKAITSSEENAVSILDVIKGILNIINDSLGGINDLDVSKEDDSTYVVVDRKNTATRKPPILNITGLSTTVVDIDLSSTISNQIASQISIAAQGSSGTFGDNISTILRWNLNSVDRHFKRKEITQDKEKLKKAQEKEEQFIEDYVDVWDDFNEFDADYIGANFTACKNGAKNLIRREATESNSKRGFIPGVIPVELKLKLLGISGMKIGQSFRISKGILPSRYNEFAYIITGLGHEIGTDNKWYTNITTQFYSIK